MTEDPQPPIQGTPVVGGVAYAPAAWVQRPAVPATVAAELPESQRDAAVESFDNAVSTVANRLEKRATRTQGSAADLLRVAAALAQDQGWRREIVERITQGLPPEQATVSATDKYIELFTKAGGVTAERVTDLVDVRDRVLAELQNLPEPGVPQRDHPVVLFATDLAPADAAGLDTESFVAIVTELGGPTSHTSIIARELGIPCVVGVHNMSQVDEGSQVLVNAHHGTVQTDIAEADAQKLITEDRERAALTEKWCGPASTLDGVAIELLANVQDGAAARVAAAKHAEGVGLFRTELLFLESAQEPSIPAQTHAYADVFSVFPDGKVVTRTLDAGSDKPLPFAAPSGEPNPALGVRGIRVAADNPDLLANQLDAIVLASEEQPTTEVWVMAPMVATIAEAKHFADQCRQRELKPGLMIEVPSTALLIEQFMEIVDFVSIGTNDLAQYLLAADRMSAPLADYTTPWQPAVLAVANHVAEAGQRLGVPVAVCGEAANDPLLACVFVGMGIRSLSMAPSAIASVGVELGETPLGSCQAAAAAVLGATGPLEARHLARQALKQD